MLERIKFFNFSKIFVISLFILMGAVFLWPNISFAQSPDLGINYANNLGLAKADPRVAIVELVRLGITFLGIIAVIYLLYAGYLWMTSAGNEEKIAKAKKTLINAVIGLAVILSSFLIVSFVISRMNDALNGVSAPGAGRGPGSSGIGLGSSGNGIIETHYPTRGQTGVPRNTSIAITFREPMMIYGAGGLIAAGDVINTSNVQIDKRDDFSPPYQANFTATTTDGLTFVFHQLAPYIGSPSESIWYTVALNNTILKANGDKAWPGAGGGYAWDFQVSTIIDVTPPRVKSIIPRPDASEPRNVVIEMNFNEAVDPISASGDTSLGFNNIEVASGTDMVDGVFYISNEYRTVEFLTNDNCGGALNSCGEPVFCLPASSSISVLAKAANTISLAGGILDMASNSLDGNKDGTAQGPQTQSGNPPYNENSPDASTQGDDYIWFFSTTDTIDISAPVITSFSPNSGETDVNYKEFPRATFNKFIMGKSLTKNEPPLGGSIALYASSSSSNNSPSSNGEVYYQLRKENGVSTSTVIIRHADFVENFDYIPEFNSGIKDIYQNCYYPSAGSDGGPVCAPNPGGGFPYCCDGVLSAVSCKP